MFRAAQTHTAYRRLRCSPLFLCNNKIIISDLSQNMKEVASNNQVAHLIFLS